MWFSLLAASPPSARTEEDASALQGVVHAHGQIKCLDGGLGCFPLRCMVGFFNFDFAFQHIPAGAANEAGRRILGSRTSAEPFSGDDLPSVWISRFNVRNWCCDQRALVTDQ